jgi:hypothetical protein
MNTLLELTDNEDNVVDEISTSFEVFRSANYEFMEVLNIPTDSDLGNYHLNCILKDEQTGEVQDTASLSLIVTGYDADLSAPETVNFGNVFVNYAESKNILLMNIGLAPLHISSLNISGTVFSVTDAVYTLDPGEQMNLQITFDTSIQGIYNEIMQITSDDPDNPITEIDLIATALEPPAISVDPAYIEVTVPEFDTETISFEVSNTGNSILNIPSIRADGISWLIISPESLNLEAGESANVQLQINTDDMALGLWNANIILISNDPESPNTLVELLLEVASFLLR